MTTSLAERPLPTTAPPRPRGGKIWARVALACALLAAAGGARAWQGRRIKAWMDQGASASFPLSEISKELGPWRAIAEASLPPEISRGIGSADSISRKYADERTGLPIDLMVLYGRAMTMHFHSPQICYPSNGHVAGTEPIRRTISYLKPDGTPAKADFLAQVFVKGDGPAAERHIVYHTWYYNNRWLPDEANPKQFQRTPGIYKVHVDRIAVPGESPESDDPKDPCESLLAETLTEMERRMAEPQPAAPGAVAEGKATPPASPAR